MIVVDRTDPSGNPLLMRGRQPESVSGRIELLIRRFADPEATVEELSGLLRGVCVLEEEDAVDTVVWNESIASCVAFVIQVAAGTLFEVGHFVGPGQTLAWTYTDATLARVALEALCDQVFVRSSDLYLLEHLAFDRMALPALIKLFSVDRARGCPCIPAVSFPLSDERSRTARKFAGELALLGLEYAGREHSVDEVVLRRLKISQPHLIDILVATSGIEILLLGGRYRLLTRRAWSTLKEWAVVRLLGGDQLYASLEDAELAGQSVAVLLHALRRQRTIQAKRDRVRAAARRR
jgi:hypothetical protein